MSSLTRSLPAGTTARGATLDDVDAVLAVIVAAEELEHGGPLTTRSDVAGDWARPSMDLSTDVVLVEEAGEVIAYGEQFLGRAFVHVRPDARGRGIGTALAAWAEDHARAAGLAQVGQTLVTTAPDAMALLEGRGYVPRFESWILKKDLDGEVAPPTLPTDVALRTARRPEDDQELYELIDTAFGDWDDRDTSMSFEDWHASYLERATDPELVLVLEAEGQLVGAALCQVEDDEGWIDQLAVARAYRRRGLGGALLQASFARFHDRGVPVAALTTDSRTGARTLYEHVGMAVTETFVRMTLTVDEPGEE